MTESTITGKGQTTVPLPIRERIGVVAGTRLVRHVMPDGAVIVRAKTASILDLAGSEGAQRQARRGRQNERLALMAALDANILVALASAAGEQPLWTFDKAAAKITGARLLPA